MLRVALVLAVLCRTVSSIPVERAASGKTSQASEQQVDGFLSQFMLAGKVPSRPESGRAQVPASVRQAAEVPPVTTGSNDDGDEGSGDGDSMMSPHPHSGYGYGRTKRDDTYFRASLDCRFFVYKYVANPRECSEVNITDYKPNVVFDNPSLNETSGACFWDFSFDITGGCLCPRGREGCELQKKQCSWYVYPDLGDIHGGARGYYGHGPKPYSTKYDGFCMHNSEKFYNLMARLLAKRGKKDLSLKIQYSSAPARGKLPSGPHGPAIIGYGPDFDKRSERKSSKWGHQSPHGEYPSHPYPPSPPYYERYPEVDDYGYEPDYQPWSDSPWSYDDNGKKPWHQPWARDEGYGYQPWNEPWNAPSYYSPDYAYPRYIEYPQTCKCPKQPPYNHYPSAGDPYLGDFQVPYYEPYQPVYEQPPHQQPYQDPYLAPPQQLYQEPYQPSPQQPYQSPPQQLYQEPYQSSPQQPYQAPPQQPYQSPQQLYQEPYQPSPQQPYQSHPQEPHQPSPQQPYQPPPQQPYQSPPQQLYQELYQPSPQQPYQPPTHQPYQSPPQQPYQEPYQPSPQQPYQVPYQTPYQPAHGGEPQP